MKGTPELKKHAPKHARTYEQGKTTVVITGLYMHQSPKAICVEFQDGQQWLPKSQFARDPLWPEGREYEKQSPVLCFLPLWLADKNDMNWAEYVEADYPEEGEADGNWLQPTTETEPEFPDDDGFDEIPF